MTAERGDAPFDLDAARAARREAQGVGFKFMWGKKAYECPPAKEWPMAVTGLLSEGKLMEAVEGILGPKQFATFMKGNPSMGDLEDLMSALAKFSGVGDSAGES
jgi:hypothetical protein